MSDPKPTDTVALTGATGFLGPSIAEALLEAGYTVRALVRNPQAARAVLPNGVVLVEGDLLDVVALEELITGCKYAVHAAGLVSFRPADDAALRTTNERGTAQVVNAALAANVRKLVHISSTAAIGRPKREARVDEDLTWADSHWNTPYGASKYRAELEIHRGVAEGLPAVILNPSVIVGPGTRGRSSDVLIAQAQKSNLCPPGTNGFVDVRDVAAAVPKALQANVSNAERFLLVSENLTYADFYRLVYAATGQRLQPKTIPYWAIRTAGWLAQLWASLAGGHTNLSVHSAKSVSCRYHYDNQRAQQMLGVKFRPVATSIRDAIAGAK